jgi:hypothetical protein
MAHSPIGFQLEGQWVRKLCIVCHGSEYCLLGADFYNNEDKIPTVGLVVKVRIRYDRSRDRCYDFKNIFAEKFGANIGVFFLKPLLAYAKI